MGSPLMLRWSCEAFWKADSDLCTLIGGFALNNTQTIELVAAVFALHPKHSNSSSVSQFDSGDGICRI